VKWARTPSTYTTTVSPEDRMRQSFLGKGDFHRIRRRYFEALKSVLRGTCLDLTLKFDECNVVPARYQTNFFETRKPTPHISSIKMNGYKQDDLLVA